MIIGKTGLKRLKRNTLGSGLSYSTDEGKLMVKVLKYLGVEEEILKVLDNDVLVYMMRAILLEYSNKNLNKLWLISLVSNGKCNVSNKTEGIIKVSLPNCVIAVSTKTNRLIIIGEFVDLTDDYRIIRKQDRKELGRIDRKFRYVDIKDSKIRGNLNYGK